ncbi:hypothetical protein LUCX_18 [Xanthomonas phage vB_XciM_LucasX]|nr:hypothetical protein LUCX_18 [Xanthomonas phage vB_XciM_LucasX]
MSTATATKKTPAAATTEVKISDAVRTLADLVSTQITIDKDGVATVPADFYESTLPENLTIQQVKAVQKHRGEVVSAVALALGEKALPIMKKNTGLDKATVGFKVGNDKSEVAVHRSREFGDGKGGKVTKYGYTTIEYTASGATNAGDFKKVRQHTSDEFAKAFG